MRKKRGGWGLDGVLNDHQVEDKVPVMKNKQTFQLGTFEEGIMPGPRVQYGGKSGSRAEAGRDQTREEEEE